MVIKMKLFSKRIIASIVALTTVISSMQLPSYTVYAEETAGENVTLESVQEDTTDEEQYNVDWPNEETENAVGAIEEDSETEGMAEGVEDSEEVNDSEETDGSEEIVSEEETDSIEQSDAQKLDDTEDIDQNNTDGLIYEAEIELDGVYQFGGAPSGEALESDTPSLSIESDGAVEDVNGVSIEDYIYNELLKRTERINVSSYSIEVGSIYAVFSGVINEHPDLYFVSKKLDYTYSGTKTIAITPEYMNNLDDAAFKRETQTALSSVKPGMSNLQKAIVLHDYLAVNCEYDYDNYLAKTIPNESYSAYGVLVKRMAVCEGYALAYKYLLNQVGIECCMVSSSAMNHAWNLIKLDGKYYQVDVTWDDPTRDLIGRACHSYMFCSDEVFKDASHGHHDWVVTSGSEVVDYKAVDTTYDNAFWSLVRSPIVLSGDNWNDCYFTYFNDDVGSGQINKAALTKLSGNGTKICDIGVWDVWGSNQFWVAVYSGLFQYKNRLYYNDKSSICSVAFDGTNKKIEYTPDTSNGYIYGMALCQGKVLYSLHQSWEISEKETVLTANIEINEEEVEIPVESITLNQDTLTLEEGETAELTAAVTPSNATNAAVTWVSGDETVATVDNGMVTAVAKGNCTITASVGDLSASCSVTVTEWAIDDAIASGEYKEDGSDIIWVIDKNGKLTVKGTGEFAAPGGGDRAPWYSNRGKITSAVINVTGMTDASYMFLDCSNLVSINLNGFDTEQIIDMRSMFNGCSSLTSLDLSNFKTTNVTDMRFMFNECNSLTSLDLSNFDTAKVTNMHAMFYSFSGNSLESINLISFDTSNVTDMSAMFSGCRNLADLDLSSFNTSNVTDMSTMFQQCYKLQSVNFGEKFDTSQVTSMSAMFSYCNKLNGLNISNFDTGKVTYMYNMFFNCAGLESLDVRHFDTSQVKDMSKMFSGCTNLQSLDVSGFVTDKVTDMSSMFFNCGSLESLDVSNFNTDNVTDMNGMFAGCGSLGNLDVTRFNTAKVTNMYRMFMLCKSLVSLDVSHFDTSQVTNMESMFSNCMSLMSLDLSNFDAAQVTNATEILGPSILIVGSNPSIPCTSLIVIRTPKNLKEMVELPKVDSGNPYVWYKADGTTLETLPTNLSESITITRDKPIGENGFIIVQMKSVVYNCGDTISTDDITVTYYDKDGNVSQITEYSTNIDEIDMSTAGTKTLEVSYNNGSAVLEATVEIYVNEKTDSGNSEGLSVKLKYPNKTYIYTGRAIIPEIEVRNNGELLAEGVDYTVKYSNNIKANTDANGQPLTNVKPAQIIVTGKGNFAGSKSQPFNIVPKNLDNSDFDENDENAMKVEGTEVADITNITIIEGNKISPSLFYGGVKLTAKDYKFVNDEYKTYKWKNEDNNTEISIEGQGNFKGIRKLNVIVIPKSEQKDYKISVTITDSKAIKNLPYNGKPQYIDDFIKVSTKKAPDASEDAVNGLKKDMDYKIYYPKDITSAGTKKVTIVGISDRCIGTVTKSYTIKPKKTELSIEFDKSNEGYTFVSTGTTVDNLVVKANGDNTPLEKGKDYKVTYSKNKKVGTGKVTVTGIGNYKGSKASKGFKINPAVLCNNKQSSSGVTAGLEITVCDKVFKKTGMYKSAPYVSIDGVLLKASNYTVTYYLDDPASNPNARVMDNKNNKVTNETGDTTVWVMIKGKGNYATTDSTCYAVASYKVRTKAESDSYDLSKAKITFKDKEGNNIKKVNYTGKPITQKDITVVVTYKIGNETVPLNSTDHYNVKFVNNVNKGKATVVITGTPGQTKYVGSKTASFNIGTSSIKNIINWFK